MSDELTTRMKARLSAADTATTVLAAIVVPQIISRSMRLTHNSMVLYAIGLAGIVCLLTVHSAISRITRFAPRRLSHEIIATHLSGGVAVVAASARFLGYVLIFVLGTGLVASGLDSIVKLSEIELRATLIILILLLSLPVLLRRGWDSRLYWVSAGLGALALTAAIVGGLVVELTGNLDLAKIASAHAEAVISGVSVEIFHPTLTAFLGGLFPAALLVLICERIYGKGRDKRVGNRWLAKRMIFLVVTVTLSLYLVILFQLPGQRMGVPTLAIADAVYGDLGSHLAAGAYIATGLAAALAAYARLPYLIEELASDGILPRRLASRDAIKPRLVMVAATAIFAASISSILVSTQAGALIFIIAMFTELGLTALALSVGAVMTLKESVDREERRNATWSKWIFFGLFVLCVAVLALSAVTSPVLLLIALVGLGLPAILMMVARRQIGKVTKSLAASDLSAGRRLPTRVHGVVLVSAVDAPTLRSISYARGYRLSSLTAVTVDYDAERTRRLRADWKRASIPVDLTVLGTPRGASRDQVVDYVHNLRAMHPGDVVTVFYSRVLTRGAWEGRFFRRPFPKVVMDLRYEPGVVLAEVPYIVDVEDDDE